VPPWIESPENFLRAFFDSDPVWAVVQGFGDAKGGTDMINGEEIIKEVRAAFEREPRIGIHNMPVKLAVSEGVLTIEGETTSVAAKKLALEKAAAVAGVSGIVDRLGVTPAEVMETGEIRNHLCDALVSEPAFSEYAILADVKGTLETVREPASQTAGVIEVEVKDGMVTLNGEVGSLSHKRLSGLFAWWVPGSRDVVNGIAVVPFMEDNDGEVNDAVRLALEKDPFVNASQIRVSCRDRIVTLDGVVPSDYEREMAEDDAWYIFGVDGVINRLEVLL
jgi:osmotically-inducible protein OsmY